MIGVVVATHGEFGNALISTMRMILGEVEGVASASLSAEDSMESFQAKLEKALTAVDPSGLGALVLVDMLGGTPFNVAVQLAQKRKLNVITGVNLPMLIKIVSHPEAEDYMMFTLEVQKATRESILTSMELLKR